MPRAITEIFQNINSCKENESFNIKASYFQIYQEDISDLLLPERTKLRIRENQERGIYIEGVSVWVVK